MKKKLAIIVTHPIQYYAPVFQLLSKDETVEIKVFYTWGEDSLKAKYDPGFGKVIDWDIPLLEGYPYEFLKNTSAAPGSHHFKGIINPEAIKRIIAFKPDAILIYGWAYQSHLKIMRHFKGKIPVWFRGDSNLLDNNNANWKTFARYIFLRWVYRYTDKVFYVGKANKDYFLKYGVPDKKLVFAPHAIDNNRFSNDHSIEAQTLRKKLQLKDNEILILFAGKLEPKKNPILLLDAFLQVNSPNLRLLFVGDGVLENQLKSKASGNPAVHFLPFQNQQKIPAIYQSCDIFCLPSHGPGETWGLAVNEAMAAGKAVIVSNKVGCASDLVATDNGYIFNSSDIEELKTILKQLTDRRDLLKMGSSSRIKVQNWSFENQVGAFLHTIYES
jgi:glycosyltransferase involved in cell wall biosynthesis